jgi:hypothetical protein
MAREMFNANLALFVSVPEGGTTFQPNPSSVVQNDRGTRCVACRVLRCAEQLWRNMRCAVLGGVACRACAGMA